METHNPTFIYLLATHLRQNNALLGIQWETDKEAALGGLLTELMQHETARAGIAISASTAIKAGQSRMVAIRNEAQDAKDKLPYLTEANDLLQSVEIATAVLEEMVNDP